jgi:coenzyme F420-reducing hydrogenase gamma subunit
MTEPQGNKPRVAFFDFTCCEGCQLTVVDSLEDHPELLSVIDIVEFREAVTGTADSYDIAFIEGSCTRESDESRLHKIRKHARFVVALGSCAHLGGINAIKNRMSIEQVRLVVYGEHAKHFETYATRPISAIIPVDCTIAGCPINAEEFLRIVTFLMQGRLPDLIDYPVCIECKLGETVCVYTQGRTCLGPITRAGCGAICPANGYKCVGCRGLTSNANIASLRQVMAEHGLSDGDIENSLSMFLTWQLDQGHAEELKHG